MVVDFFQIVQEATQCDFREFRVSVPQRGFGDEIEMGDREWRKRLLQFIGVPSLSQLSPLFSCPFQSPEGDSWTR